MLARARALPSSRIAAAVVALSLSGLPGAAARAMGTPGVECTCPSHKARHSHDHPCECASRHAGGAPAEPAPPCHGSARKPAGDSSPAPSASCARIAGCGAPLPEAAPPPSIDPFALPDPVQLASVGPLEALAIALARPRDVALPPDTPPPRRA
jgi:hypothetical protein